MILSLHRNIRPSFAINVRYASEKVQFSPGVYMVATPIGNMGDVSDRARQLLRYDFPLHLTIQFLTLFIQYQSSRCNLC
jgi:hypothetical protein